MLILKIKKPGAPAGQPPKDPDPAQPQDMDALSLVASLSKEPPAPTSSKKSLKLFGPPPKGSKAVLIDAKSGHSFDQVLLQHVAKQKKEQEEFDAMSDAEKKAYMELAAQKQMDVAKILAALGPSGPSVFLVKGKK